MHWGSGIFGCSPCSPISTFLHTFFTHFHHIYSFSRLIDMVIHFEGACYRTSYFPPHFSVLSVADVLLLPLSLPPGGGSPGPGPLRRLPPLPAGFWPGSARPWAPMAP